jgi:hypothetical protein
VRSGVFSFSGVASGRVLIRYLHESIAGTFIGVRPSAPRPPVASTVSHGGSLMTRFLLILFAVMSCAQAVAQTRIDASSEDTFNASLRLMKQELVLKKLTQLETAITILPFAGMQSVKDTPSDGVVKLDQKKLNGMTADQIIELAQKTLTVKFFIGPPPGLPDRFKLPWRPGLSTTPSDVEVKPLAGTQWIVIDNINGHMSEERLRLLPDGKVDDGVSTSGRWQQIGANVRIALNDNYAVYLGTLDKSANMHGTAANINGTDWTWVAKLSDPL